MFKKVLTLMTLIVMLFSLIACGRSNEVIVSENYDSGVSKNQNENISLTDGTVSLSEGERIGPVTACGDKLWFITTTEDYWLLGNRIYSVGLDGSGLEERVFVETNMFNNIAACDNDTVWACVKEMLEVDGFPLYCDTQIIHYDAFGAEVARLDLLELLNTNEPQLGAMLPGDDGGVILYAGEMIYLLDADGGVIREIEISDGYFSSLTRLKDGLVAGVYWGSDNTGAGSKTYIASVDMEEGTVVRLGEIDAHSYSSILGGDSNTIWMDNGTVCSFDVASATLESRFAWLNMNVNNAELAEAIFGEDGTVVVVEQTDNDTSLSIYPIQVEKNESTESAVLTLACMMSSADINEAVLEFNRAHTNCQIELKDYINEYGSISAALEQFNYEVMSGEVPDIYLLGSMPYETLVNKGLLADLYPFLESDPEMGKDDFLKSILSAQEVDGSLYSLITYFCLETVAGLEEMVGTESGCTVEDYRALMEQYSDIQIFEYLDKSEALYHLTKANMDKFVDFSGGTCSFDSEEYIELMELVYEMNSCSWTEGAVITGESVLEICSLESYAAYLTPYYNRGGEVTFVGWPGASAATVIPIVEMAISSQSEAPEVCWEFIRQFYLAEYQSSLAEDYVGFSVRKDCLKAEAENYIALAEIEPAINASQAEKVSELLNSASVIYRDRSQMSEILGIVQEEGESYFSGAKTAEDVANGIQSRASIYMAEQG